MKGWIDFEVAKLAYEANCNICAESAYDVNHKGVLTDLPIYIPNSTKYYCAYKIDDLLEWLITKGIELFVKVCYRDIFFENVTMKQKIYICCFVDTEKKEIVEICGDIDKNKSLKFGMIWALDKIINNK